MLGIHLGRWRAALVAILGWAGGLFITALILNRDPGVAEGVPTTVFFGVVVAMPVAIVLDLVTRSTSRSRPRRWRRTLTHPVRSTRNAFAPWGRLREVAKDARQHTLVHVRYRSEQALGSPDFARRLRLMLDDAGGMMVKFGQIASTRTDLLPEPLTTELAHLRSDVRPIPADAVRTVIEDSLDEPVETAFATFEWEPLAAASIGFDFAAAGQEIARADVAATIGSPESVLQRELIRSLPSLRTLPEHAEAIAGQLRGGRLTLRTEHYSGEDRAVVDQWVDRALVGFIGGVGAAASALLLIARAARIPRPYAKPSGSLASAG